MTPLHVSPLETAKMFSVLIRPISAMAPAETPAQWEESTVFSRASSVLFPMGSVLNTSRAAPRMVPFFSASHRSSSWTRPPVRY